MEKKASPILLILPVGLLIVIVVLIVLILTSLNKSAPVVVDTPPATNNTNQNSNNGQPAPPTNTNGNSAEANSLDKAMNAVPKSGFPDNTCPSHIVLESNGNKFAIQGEDKFTITATQLTWIQANCSEVKTLNF